MRVYSMGMPSAAKCLAMKIMVFKDNMEIIIAVAVRAQVLTSSSSSLHRRHHRHYIHCGQKSIGG